MNKVKNATEVVQIDRKLISDVCVEGIDMQDYPDFVDAFIAEASYDGREATEAELEAMNADYDLVYHYVQNKIY